MWSAAEHAHQPKSNEWYIILGIFCASLIIASLFFLNFILALLIAVAGGTVALIASKEPSERIYTLTSEGVYIDNQLFAYSRCKSFQVIERPFESLLIIDMSELFMPHLYIPISMEYGDDEVREYLRQYCIEKNEGIPLPHLIMEAIGF